MSLVWQGAMHGGRTGATVGAFGGPWGAAAGAVAGAAVGGLAGWWVGDQLASTIHSEADRATATTSAAATDEACANCEKDPCKALERGTGSGPYRGGSHRQMQLPVGDGLESHHTPADSASPLSRPDGPAIQMTESDHRQTRSHGNSLSARAYQRSQRAMIASGNAMGAIALDVADVRRIATAAGDPGRYDVAIAEMETYAACLQATGRLR